MTDKDKILHDISMLTPYEKIVGIDTCLSEFEQNGLVMVRRDEQGKPITIRLTKQGHDFINSGGYTAKRKNKRKRIAATHSKYLLKGLYAVLSSVIAGLIVWLLTHQS